MLITSCAKMALNTANGLATLGSFHSAEALPYGAAPLNQLDIHIPDNIHQNETRPVIVFFYGGCWGACNTINKENHTFVAEFFTALGYITVIPDYRRYPDHHFKDIMQDAAKATEWVNHNIQQYQGDSNQIVLAGFSAGAHIASMLTLNEHYLSANTRQHIKGFIGLSGPYDFEINEDYQRVVFGPVSAYPNSQPVNFVDGNEPPLLLLYGDNDTLVLPRNIQGLSQKVRQLEGEVTARIYLGMDHVDMLSALSIPKRHPKILNDINQFLNNILSKQHFQSASTKVKLEALTTIKKGTLYDFNKHHCTLCLTTH